MVVEMTESGESWPFFHLASASANSIPPARSARGAGVRARKSRAGPCSTMRAGRPSSSGRPDVWRPVPRPDFRVPGLFGTLGSLESRSI